MKFDPDVLFSVLFYLAMVILSFLLTWHGTSATPLFQYWSSIAIEQSCFSSFPMLSSEKPKEIDKKQANE